MSQIDDSWKETEFRQKTTENIDSIIKATGLQEKITAEKLEAGIFLKSDSKERYLTNVSKVITHLQNKGNSQSNMKTQDTNHDEKKDEMEKSNCDNKINSQEQIENQKDPIEMEGALKRLSLSEGITVKKEKDQIPSTILKTVILEHRPTPSPEIIKPSELKISQVHENVRQTENPANTQNNKTSEIRIAQVHSSFNSIPITRNSPILSQRNPGALHPMNVGIRHSVPRILNVTSLHRSPQPAPRLNPFVKPPQLPPLGYQNSQRSIFDDATRFKYRDSIIRKMMATEETVFNQARSKEHYVNFFQNLFAETSNQVYMDPESQLKTRIESSRVSETSQNIYNLLTHEPERVKHAVIEDFKAIDLQIKSILKNWAADPDDVSFKDVKILPDEFERNLSIFCAKMSANYSFSENRDMI